MDDKKGHIILFAHEARQQVLNLVCIYVRRFVSSFEPHPFDRKQYEDRDKAAQREISRTESYEGEESIRHRENRRSRMLLRSNARRDFLENWER